MQRKSTSLRVAQDSIDKALPAHNGLAEAATLQSPPSTPPIDEDETVTITAGGCPIAPSIHGEDQLKSLSQHAARVEGVAGASVARRSWYAGNTSTILLVEAQQLVQSDIQFLDTALADLVKLSAQANQRLEAGLVENYINACEGTQRESTALGSSYSYEQRPFIRASH